MVAVLEIDVAKDSLAAALLEPPTTRKQHLSEIQACLHATGTYADAIAEARHDTGYAVAVVNPARIAAYASWRA